jgi:FkbM family methyltransferase
MTRISTLTITDGVRIVTPDSTGLITPYVLYEQQDWFEDEIGFLRRLLQPGEQVVDIGANYGVYTLSMARSVGPRGNVWAFEPASSTADFLRQGIAANGFGNVTLERSALSNAIGTARLSTSEHSELNALEHGGSSQGSAETVQVVTLDDAMTRYLWTDIALLKMDAEGEERRIIEGGRQFFSKLSPLVLYEVRAGESLHLHLVDDFAALGYESYRLVPGLDVLVPFDANEPVDGFQLNLFCCKPDRAAVLAKHWRLVERSAGGVPPAADRNTSADPRERLAALPYAASLAAAWGTAPTAGRRSEVYQALSDYFASRNEDLDAAERFRALRSAFRSLIKLCTEEPSHLRHASLARVAAEFGERAIAANALGKLYQKYAQTCHFDMSEPFLAVSRRFDYVAPTGDIQRWFLASVLENLEKLSAFSSYFTGKAAMSRLEAIESLGYASEEMRRRLQLVRLRHPAPPAGA